MYTVGNHYYLDCKTEGDFWLIAVQNGNNNYYSTPRIRKKVVIGAASSINTIANGAAKIIRTSWGIRVLDANMGEFICIFTLDGQLINSTKADSKTVDIRLIRHGMYIVKTGRKSVKIRY